MKKRKWVGAGLIAASLMLQVGYATTVNTPIGMIENTGDYDVFFDQEISGSCSEFMSITPTAKDTTLEIIVNNLYPGGKFEVEPVIRNNGTIKAKIKDISLTIPTNDSTDNGKLLADQFVGYDAQGNKVSNYNKYLVDTYKGKILNQNDTLPLHFGLGMDIDETEMEGETLKFQINVALEQYTSGGGGGGGTVTPPKPEEPEEPTVIEPEEPPLVPEPPVDPTEPGDENGEGGTTIEENETPTGQVPGGTNDGGKDSQGNKLPKTGAIPAGLIYGAGLAMLGGGITLYRKKEDE